MSKPSWLEYKAGLGFDFPNLPYYQVVADHIISFIILSGRGISCHI